MSGKHGLENERQCTEIGLRTELEAGSVVGDVVIVVRFCGMATLILCLFSIFVSEVWRREVDRHDGRKVCVCAPVDPHTLDTPSLTDPIAVLR